MRILFINKFLYKNGGSETYIFSLGDFLMAHGHEVQYFGMEHEGRCVGNRVNAYTSNMDFHGGSIISKITYPLKTVRSKEAAKKIRLVLDDFRPDVIHLNNFNFQLTPTVITETVKWREQTGNKVKIIFTAHDYQLICPNHMMMNPNTGEICEKCIGGNFSKCSENKCIHGSKLKSTIGSYEGNYWKKKGVYKYLDKIICPSEFLKSKMDSNPLFADKTMAMHNFIDVENITEVNKEEYVLYFGRYAQEKGFKTLIEACKKLPDIKFKFAGGGPLEESLANVENIENLGFLTGDDLKNLIANALFSIYPSQWYENCPFSVMESQRYLTPVLGADIGGIPELINNNVTGELFESGNVNDLAEKISNMYSDREKLKRYSNNCKSVGFDNIEQYGEKLLKIYSE